MIVNKANDRYMYFLYSEHQNRERSRIEKSMSRVFVPGKVVVNGRKFDFTEMSNKPTNRYPDCKLVAEGYLSKMVIIPIMTR